MTKTRIRVSYKYGDKQYLPEYKLLWWWEKIYRYEWGVYHWSFKTLDAAKLAVDEFLSDRSHKTKDEVIKYP